MASATTSKSELSFVPYLYSCLRQHGNTLPGSVRPLLGLKLNSKVLLQALKYGCKQEHATALQEALQQVRHRDDSKNSLLILVLIHQVLSELDDTRRV